MLDETSAIFQTVEASLLALQEFDMFQLLRWV